jgi:hypothetical protein
MEETARCIEILSGGLAAAEVNRRVRRYPGEGFFWSDHPKTKSWMSSAIVWPLFAVAILFGFAIGGAVMQEQWAYLPAFVLLAFIPMWIAWQFLYSPLFRHAGWWRFGPLKGRSRRSG